VKQVEFAMSASSNLGSEFSENVKSSATWGIVLGILTALLGVLLLAYPLFAATVTTMVIGWTLIAVAIFEVVQAFRGNSVGHFFGRLLLGLVYGFGGVQLLLHPLWGVTVLTVLLGTILLFEAGATAVWAFQVKPVSGWLLVDAVITAILGLLILAHWPSSSLWAIGTLVGVAVLMRGITRIALSTGLRRVAKGVEEIHTRPRRAA
jgi:uncharacterized membrane protein HdeD (DUF308 family)